MRYPELGIQSYAPCPTASVASSRGDNDFNRAATLGSKLRREVSISGTASFTLIELLAAMAILVSIMLILVSVFNSTSNLATQNQRRIELNQVVRAVLEQISRDIQRAASLGNVVSMASGPGGSGYIGGFVPTNTLFLLCDIQPPEPNPYGSLVNIGYQITSTNVGGIQKFALERGDDSGVLTTGSCSNSWWNSSACTTSTDPYWKLLSENIIGIDFYFYTNTTSVVSDNSFNQHTYLTSWTSNALPSSVGVSIYTIDSRSYNRALTLDPALASSAAVSTITNNMRFYFTRIFLPRASQNP